MVEIVPCPDCGRPRAEGHPCPSCRLAGRATSAYTPAAPSAPPAGQAPPPAYPSPPAAFGPPLSRSAQNGLAQTSGLSLQGLSAQSQAIAPPAAYPPPQSGYVAPTPYSPPAPYSPPESTWTQPAGSPVRMPPAASRSSSTRKPVWISVAVVVLLAIAYAVFHFYIDDGGAGGTKTYVDKQASYAFEYPSSWKKMPYVSATGSASPFALGQVALGNPRGAKSNGLAVDMILVGAVKGATNLTGSDPSSVLRSLKSFLTSLVSQTPAIRASDRPTEFVTSTGLRGITTTWTETLNGQSVRGGIYVLPAGQMIYLICVQASEADWPTCKPLFDATVQSFKVVSST